MAKTGGGRLLQGGRALLLKQMGRGAEACAIVAALLSKAQHNPTSAQLHNPTLAAHFASIAAMASYHQTRKAINRCSLGRCRNDSQELGPLIQALETNGVRFED